MSYFKLKLGLLGLGIAFMSVPSTAQAQNYARKGVVAGAIIGAIAGAQNDRALGGAVIGGVVGGVAGNAIDRSYQSRYGYRGYPATTRYGNTYGNRQPTFYPPTRYPAYYGGSRYNYYCPSRGW